MTTTLTSNEQPEPNLTEQDKTRFLERGFAVVENTGHSLRFIKRDDPRQAISIKWDDLSALRELITLTLDDGPMVIGLDTSGQAAKNAATQMRNKCVETVREIHEERLRDLRTLTENGEVAQEDAEYERAVLFVLSNVIDSLKSLSLDDTTRDEGLYPAGDVYKDED